MFYVAHRLFAAHDRALGALAARRIAQEVEPTQVFLPFCDTDEENLVADVKGRRIFEIDRERLTQLDGMLAVLHGPSLDDGVCMEIGYAAAVGVPIVVLTTDFITYGLADHGPALAFPDPLIQIIAGDVVHVSKLGPEPAGPGHRFEAFGRRNQDQVASAIERAVARLLSLAGTSRPRIAPGPTSDRVVFCEPSPYRDDRGWLRLISHLQQRGYDVQSAVRLSAADPLTAAASDWAALAHAGCLVADTSGPETPPGAAAMIGACAARGQRVFAHQPALSWTFAHDREPNWRNLMIQYATDARITDIGTLIRLIGE